MNNYMDFYARRSNPLGSPLQRYQPMQTGSALNLAGNAPPPDIGASERIHKYLNPDAPDSGLAAGDVSGRLQEWIKKQAAEGAGKAAGAAGAAGKSSWSSL